MCNVLSMMNIMTIFAYSYTLPLELFTIYNKLMELDSSLAIVSILFISLPGPIVHTWSSPRCPIIIWSLVAIYLPNWKGHISVRHAHYFIVVNKSSIVIFHSNILSKQTCGPTNLNQPRTASIFPSLNPYYSGA